MDCQISGLNKVQVKETDTCPPSSSTGVDSKDADFPAAINLELSLLQFHVSKVRTCPAERRESCFLVTCPGKLSVTGFMWNLHPELLCCSLQLAPKGCHAPAMGCTAMNAGWMFNPGETLTMPLVCCPLSLVSVQPLPVVEITSNDSRQAGLVLVPPESSGTHVCDERHPSRRWCQGRQVLVSSF